MLRCSFCNKTQDDVRKLIAGPEVYICDECVRVCLDIMEEDQATTEASDLGETSSEWRGGALAIPCGLCGMPMPTRSALLVENRGVLCSACLGAVQAAAAARDEGDPQA